MNKYADLLNELDAYIRKTIRDSMSEIVLTEEEVDILTTRATEDWIELNESRLRSARKGLHEMSSAATDEFNIPYPSSKGQYYVYLMDGADLTKIGLSSNPASRRETIQRMCPVPISLVKVFGPYTDKDASKLERGLHRKLKVLDHTVNGLTYQKKIGRG